MKRTPLLLFALLMATALMAQTKTITFTIGDSLNPPGTQHKVYHRLAGGAFTAADSKDCGTALTCSWAYPSMALGVHEFAATAYVVSGGTTLESAYSTIVSWTNAPQPPTLTITNIASNSFFKGATLLAQTTAPARTYIDYGMGTALNARRTVDTTAQTDHSVTLTFLRPHTTYSYRWTAVAADGTTVQSEVFTFTTL